MTIKNICTNCQLVTTSNPKRYQVIFSYETPVLAIDGSGKDPVLVRLWSGWSATTQRHINKALDYIMLEHINKATWNKMPVMSVNI